MVRKALIAVVLLLIGLVPSAYGQTGNEETICLTTPVFFCENFEDRSVQTFYEQQMGDMNQARYKNGGWGANPNTQLFIVASPAMGSRAMQWHYPCSPRPPGPTRTADQRASSTCASMGDIRRTFRLVVRMGLRLTQSPTNLLTVPTNGWR
jgi:hypothetical protein